MLLFQPKNASFMTCVQRKQKVNSNKRNTQPTVAETVFAAKIREIIFMWTVYIFSTVINWMKME